MRDDPSVGKLQMGLPALDAFPRKLWSRLVSRRVRGASALAAPPPCGFRPLRESIAAYLHRSRGIACATEQVIVVPGYGATLGLVAKTLLRPGDRAWVESPGYPPTSWGLDRLGMETVAVPVDAHGINVAQGIRRCPEARLAVVTPSHQSPLGVSLSMPRRIALLAWANDADAWIVEDDYDGEFRYTGHPLPALKSLDRGDRVIYSGTFSKVLFPGLRIGYIVVPRRQIEAFRALCETGLWGHSPELLQAATHDFIAGGDFARHVRKMRTLYALRRSYLSNALTELAGSDVEVHLTHGGMHLLARLAKRGRDAELVRRARSSGFGIRALSDWSAEKDAQEGLLMGFTNVQSNADARRQVAQMLAAFPPRT